MNSFLSRIVKVLQPCIGGKLGIPYCGQDLDHGGECSRVVIRRARTSRITRRLHSGFLRPQLQQTLEGVVGDGAFEAADDITLVQCLCHLREYFIYGCGIKADDILGVCQ